MISAQDSIASARASRSPSGQPKRRPNSRLAPDDCGWPDSRGWSVYKSTNKDRPLITHYARAFFPDRVASVPQGKWVTRSFRSEAEAIAFCEAENARNPNFAPPLPEVEPQSAETLGLQLLTSRELASRLHLSRDGLNHLRERGLPFLRVARNKLLYRWPEVVAWLEEDRRQGKRRRAPENTASEKVFTVKPYKVAHRPDLKFRVEGMVNGKRTQSFFATHEEAVAAAAKLNHAHGRIPRAPLPDYVRGMKPGGPFWRVREFRNARLPQLRFQVFAKIAGVWHTRNAPTLRAALTLANDLNFDVLAAHFVRKDELPAAPDVLQDRQTLPAAEWHTPTPGVDLTSPADRMPQFHVQRFSHKRYPWCVSSTLGGQRKRKPFKTEAEAKQYAHVKNTEARQQGIESLEFPSWLRTMAQRCQERLAPHRASIEDATRHFLEHLERTQRSIPFSQLRAELLAEKARKGVSKGYIRDLKETLARFAAFIGEEIIVSNVTPQLITEFLKTLPATWSPASRNHVLTHLNTTFGFARTLGYCHENPALKVEYAKTVEVPVGIFTVDQLSSLLHATLANRMTSHYVPFLAIGAFAGLRGSELRRLDWSEVDLVDGFIEVTAAKAKTAKRRLVKILPNLAAWLRPYAQPSGPVYPNQWFNPGQALSDIMEAVGIKEWPRNALRHSFASYHLAHFKDAAALALEMGHTTTNLIFAHYRQVVRASQGERYWQIMPPASHTGNVVPFAEPHTSAAQG